MYAYNYTTALSIITCTVRDGAPGDVSFESVSVSVCAFGVRCSVIVCVLYWVVSSVSLFDGNRCAATEAPEPGSSRSEEVLVEGEGEGTGRKGEGWQGTNGGYDETGYGVDG